MPLHIQYLRASTPNQTPELQIRDIQTLNPPADIQTIKEHGSAWKENVTRPEFEKLIALIKKGKVATLYVWSIDRLYRDRKKLVNFLTLCRNQGVKVYSYNQRWLEDVQKIQPPFDEVIFDMILAILGFMAEVESTLKSNRVKTAVNKKKNGTFSYKGRKWGRRAFPQQTINRVLQLRKAGYSIREIAASVQVSDKNHKKRHIPKSCVFSILTRFPEKKESRKKCPKKIDFWT